MTDATSLHLLEPTGRPALERLWQLYRHDLSEFRGMLPDAEGRFTAGRLPDYVEEHPDRRAYVVRYGGAPAGFALVRGVAEEPRHMTEFFVVRAVRGRSVGHEVATRVLRAHPGRWEIAFQDENPGAARFWRRVAGELAAEPVREERRPVPGKPHLPPDVWLLLTV